MAANSTSTSLSLKEYLKRYQSGADDPKKQKKKKKKEKPKPTAMGGIVVVDEDPVWQKPVKMEEEIESSDDEKPQIDEDIEVKRMKRLEAIRARKAYHAISEDGSGWVPVSNPENAPLGSGDGDRDMSPPRKSRARFDTPSPEHDRNVGAGESDISPPRQRQSRADTPSRSPTRRERRADTPSPSRTHRRSRADTPSPSPKQRRRRADTSSPSPKRATEVPGNDLGNASPARRGMQPMEDISPPRRREQIQTSGANICPPRSRKGVPDDLSPPRRRAEEATDLSPPRRRRNESSNDISPPGHSRRDKTKGLSPTRHHSDKPADLSPPRRRQKVSSREISPSPRSRSFAADLSPNRRSSKGSAADFSPPRRGRPCSPRSVKLHESHAADLSPPRKNRNEAPLTKQRAGLFLSGKDFGEEIKQKKKEESLRLASMDPLKIGKGAEPVFRDKTGKVISKEEISKSKEEEKPKEKKLEWGKGLAQKREAEAMAEELEHERHKLFSRTRDDPELDKMFKERLRWGDPMAHLVKRKQTELNLEDLGDDEKMKESGFIIPQTVPSHSWLKRGIDFPPNRYGIRPGRHWDGVDRSNGYEKELFKRRNEKRATEQEAYLWSVSDM